MKNYHFIGIGGAGMSGLARLALEQNIAVSGSDLVSSPVTDALVSQGANVFIGHAAANIRQNMTIIYSTDIKNSNPEYQAALHLKCPMMHRSELLQKLMEGCQSITVAGTHGKTTTSALLAWVLEYSGKFPGYAIGGVVPQLASAVMNNRSKSDYFVAEACESDGSFLNYSPHAAIITNIDLDHMDFFGDERSLKAAFNQFIQQVSCKELLFWCGDDSRLQEMSPNGMSYGFNQNCILKASDFKQKGWKLYFTAELKGHCYKNIEVALTGKHNALNALAVFGMAISLGLDETTIRNAFSTFAGILRRCEKKGEKGGILFIDDYGHHPTEIKATLRAIRKAIGEKRLIVAYQPHRYTRTLDCKGMYGKVFDEADLLLITEIYPAREAPIEGVTHEMILEEAKSALKDRTYHINRKNIAAELSSLLRPHDVLVTLGAGDITEVYSEISERFMLNSPAKLKLGLIFGGKSVEHEISLISSANIHASLNQDYYDIVQFGITKEGKWIHGDHSRNELGNSLAEKQVVSTDVLNALLECDILFPVLHGTNGEDGTIQALLELFSKAYVGCDYRSSAICMDKVLSKRLASQAGLPVLPFVSFKRDEWNHCKEQILEKIEKQLIFPVFVKAVHLGSSIGIHKVLTSQMLAEAIEDSFRFDDILMVENSLENMREIEFSLLGNDEPIVFPPGEVLIEGQIHNFDTKYGLNPNKSPAKFHAKADLPQEKIDEGMKLALAIYKTLGCIGMSRIDTFLDSHGKFWFNEINPIPGFTKYSLYPLMCEANGFPLSDLLDKLLISGMQRRRQLDRLEVSHDEQV